MELNIRLRNSWVRICALLGRIGCKVMKYVFLLTSIEHPFYRRRKVRYLIFITIMTHN